MAGQVIQGFSNSDDDDVFPKLAEGVHSWYLEVGGKTYWLSREDGNEIRRMGLFNRSGFHYNFEFTPLGETLPVIIHITPETAYTLTASGDD